MNSVWKWALAAGAILVLAGTAVGFVAAQSDGESAPTEAQETPETADDPTDGRRGEDFLDRLAGNLGIGFEDLESAWRQTQLDVIDEKVADGTIDEERAAEFRERIESGDAPFFPVKRQHHGGGGWNLKADVAEFLGLEPQALLEALSDSQSLAQVAESQGVSSEELTQYLLDEIQAYVDEMLAGGSIDQARADEIVQGAPERIEEMINREGMSGKHGSRGGPGPRGSGEGFGPASRFIPNGADEVEELAPTTA